MLLLDVPETKRLLSAIISVVVINLADTVTSRYFGDYGLDMAVQLNGPVGIAV